jgi:hypothetical protein
VRRPGWYDNLSDHFLPGANIVLITPDPEWAVEGRLVGLQLRDTLLVLRPLDTLFAFLFRLPSDLGVTETAISHGTGLLNIDASRVLWKSEEERLSALPGSMPRANESVGTFQTRDRTAEKPEDAQSPLGRWPANVALIHTPSCACVGSTRIEGHKGYPNGPGGSSSQFSQKGIKTTRTEAWKGHADEEGLETVPVWECHERCPVRLLDEQSGVLTSGSFNQASRKAKNAVYGKFEKYSDPKMYEASSGGASRFYPQFETSRAFFTWLVRLVGVPGRTLIVH